jgi:predicted AAA+ superfamily ATPase
MTDGPMNVFDRYYAAPLAERLRRPYVHILFGARQTGKTTLLKSLLPEETLVVNMADPAERARHLAQPGEFAALCRAMPARREARHVLVDEVQAVPSIFDSVQELFDSDRSRWRFVLCGSSARKLRRGGANLLPGRSFLHHLLPVILCEQPPHPVPRPAVASPLPLPAPAGFPAKPFPAWGIEERLAFGSLPGIIAAAPGDRGELLQAFAVIYLEEEIRREALVRDWGAFVRFLRLAALSSGQHLNYAAVSQETGVTQPTVKAHYQLLEDMFVGFPVPAWTRSRRGNLLRTPRFFFFDLGVRHAAAGLAPGADTVRADAGPLFEQWVGIELWKRLQYLGKGGLYHLRSRDGAEIDFVVEQGNRLVPLEAKWTANPSLRDARHLLSFLDEHPGRADMGYIVCRCPRPLQLHEKITALPWQLL